MVQDVTYDQVIKTTIGAAVFKGAAAAVERGVFGIIVVGPLNAAHLSLQLGPTGALFATSSAIVAV
jgi:hypothetical protein